MIPLHKAFPRLTVRSCVRKVRRSLSGQGSAVSYVLRTKGKDVATIRPDDVWMIRNAIRGLQGKELTPM